MLAILETVVGLVRGLLGIGGTAMNFRNRKPKEPVVEIEVRAVGNVRDDTVVFYCVKNLGRVDLIMRDVICRAPKADILYGLPMEMGSVEAYGDWLIDTGWKTIGDPRPRPFVTPAGGTVCTFIVVPGRHPEVSLSMAFDPVDGGRRIRTRVQAVDRMQQSMGYAV